MGLSAKPQKCWTVINIFSSPELNCRLHDGQGRRNDNGDQHERCQSSQIRRHLQRSSRRQADQTGRLQRPSDQQPDPESESVREPTEAARRLIRLAARTHERSRQAFQLSEFALFWLFRLHPADSEFR